jgi:hypothetical protein
MKPILAFAAGMIAASLLYACLAYINRPPDVEPYQSDFPTPMDSLYAPDPALQDSVMEIYKTPQAQVPK